MEDKRWERNLQDIVHDKPKVTHEPQEKQLDFMQSPSRKRFGPILGILKTCSQKLKVSDDDEPNNHHIAKQKPNEQPSNKEESQIESSKSDLNNRKRTKDEVTELDNQNAKLMNTVVEENKSESNKFVKVESSQDPNCGSNDRVQVTVDNKSNDATTKTKPKRSTKKSTKKNTKGVKSKRHKKDAEKALAA